MEEAADEATPKKNRAWIVYLYFSIFSLGSFWYIYHIEKTSPAPSIMTAQRQIIGIGLMLLSPLIITPFMKLLQLIRPDIPEDALAVPPFWRVLKYTLIFGVPTIVGIWLFALFVVEQPMEEPYDRALFGSFTMIVLIPAIMSILARSTRLQTFRAFEKITWRVMIPCGAISIISGMLFAAH